MTCATTKPGTDAGAIPANVSENARPTVTAGLAKDVEDVNQYAAPMYAPTAGAASMPRPLRASAKTSATRPRVATTSPSSRWAPVRSLVERSPSGTWYMRLASSAPATAPITCTTEYAATSAPDSPVRARRPSSQSTAETTGLKCAPDTGPNSRMSTVSPRNVAVEFSSSCRPTSPGERRSAAMPEPTTTVTSRPVPRSSAVSRLPRSVGSLGTDPVVDMRWRVLRLVERMEASVADAAAVPGTGRER